MIRKETASLWLIGLLFLLATCEQPNIAPTETAVPPLPPSPPAANADVLNVDVQETAPGLWRFTVTVTHPDSGWEDYADGWDVVLPDGTVAKVDDGSPFTRLLAHPHENEQPFTRSQSNIPIPADVTSVTVRAHDLVDGFGGQEMVVTLRRAALPPPSLTPQPTITNTPSPTPTATPSPSPTPVPLSPCTQRVPSDDDLLTIVTLRYPISEEYEPADLVPLADYFDRDITFGYPTELREIVIAPLVQMIDAMHAAGLRPQIISGYRSYYQQNIAWNKWSELEPERAAMLSAPPGHSEHQLGTTLDFGSPELAEIVDDEEIEFHTYFYKTGEGKWLREHAHEYGFDLSYPREASELTGFFYEPWHFRYIGVELATQLVEEGRSLTAYLMETVVYPPCTLD